MLMCQWMPWLGPWAGSPPPVFTSITVSTRVLPSSDSKCTRVVNWAPKNFWGQWHCSQVSWAGRRFSMGVGMGRGYLLRRTAYTWYTPEILAFTYHSAPGPTWHSAHVTRAWGECW